MRLKELIELTWRLYQNGKAYATSQFILEQDIEQKCKLLFADAMRQRVYESMKSDEFGRPDYSFVSPILEIKKFLLGETGDLKFRRCDMGDLDLYRLPKNAHFSNVYPVGSCTNDVGTLTQVSPGEENFYVQDPDLSSFMFYVVKGRGINAYNVPPCVKELAIETTYDIGDDIDIEKSIASAIVDQILNVVLGIKKQYYSEDAQRQIEEQNVIK